jgi:hypothetical protein
MNWADESMDGYAAVLGYNRRHCVAVLIGAIFDSSMTT